MTNHVSIEHHADGRTVACKRSTAPDGGPRIRDEAFRLEGLDHPGVLSFVELRDTEGGPVLVTEYVGPRTLASIGPVTAERAARLVGHLASTIADLHARGLVHGAVRPEHVLVSGDRTVLCGLTLSSEDHSPADDVLGVGLTLRDLLAPELEEEPIPDRRPWRRTPWHGYRHRALLTLADQATDEDQRHRPGARALAEAVVSLSGAPPRGRTEERAPRSAPAWPEAVIDFLAIHRPFRRAPAAPGDDPSRRRPPARVALLGAVGLGLGGLGIVGLSDDADQPTGGPPVEPAAESARCRDVVDDPSADVDGDGCPEPVRIGHGWVEVDGHRFRVGQPGNALAIGDWDGDGAATVALLQRGTGDVWRFPTWDPEAAVTAEPAGHYPGAIDLERRATSGVDVLVVRLRDGASTEVPVG